VSGPGKVDPPFVRLMGRPARRLLSDAGAASDPRRASDGWERRFVTDARRAPEVIALYGALGYEVAADPLRPEEMPEDCETCQLALLAFRTIYTRRPRGATGGKETR
jgi:hypothetical protein